MQRFPLAAPPCYIRVLGAADPTQSVQAKGVKIIKALQWTGRIIAIVAVVMAIIIALSGGWGDAIYALFLAGAVWYWTDYVVARMTRSGERQAAARGRLPSEPK